MQEPMPALLIDASLGTLASAVRRRMKHLIMARMVPYDLTIHQLWAILIIHQKGPTSLHPLAEQIWADDPTASRVVKSLVHRGILHTQPDPRHGRRILINLTDKAKPLAEELDGLTQEIRAAVVSGISAQDQELMRGGLHAMIANLDSLLAACPSEDSGSDTAAAR